jgi:hypothetical protein
MRGERAGFLALPVLNPSSARVRSAANRPSLTSKQLQQEVLDLDFVMGLRQAKAGGGLQGFSAGVVQFPDQGFQICFRHIASSVRWFSNNCRT